MEKKIYFSPTMKIHALALHCAMLDSLSGDGKGSKGDEGEAKSSTVSFDDWDDSIEE